AGHDGKAASRLAGAGGFDRSVKRQDIGLEGDLFDQRDNIADLAGAVVYALHGIDYVADHGAAALGNLHAVVGQLAGKVGVVGILFDGNRQFFHAGGGFLQGRSLVFGTCGQIGVAGVQDLRHAGRGVSASVHIVGNPQQALTHQVQVEVQVAHFAFLVRIDVDQQVAGGNLASDLGGAFQRLDDTLCNAPAIGQAGQGTDTDGGQCPRLVLGRNTTGQSQPRSARDRDGGQRGHAEHAGLQGLCEG